jgi:tetratricopeptide (TPR) repeat protein
MYQRKIQRWELEKKHKAPEMRAILRIARQRQAAGLHSIFRIRGRPTEIAEVLRYFKRRGEDPDNVDVGDAPTPSTITVETPPANPPRPPPPAAPQLPVFDIIDDDDGYDEFDEGPPSIASDQSLIPYPTPETEYGFIFSACSSSGSSVRSDSVASSPLVFPDGPLICQMTPNNPFLPMGIDPTWEFYCSRYLLCWTQLFFDHIVPPHFYAQDGANRIMSKPWRRTMSTWSQATSEGQELAQSDQLNEAFDLRRKALDNVKKHITNRSPITLLRYFEIIYSLCNSGDDRDISFLDVTLNHVLGMAETVLREGHPILGLTRLFRHPYARPIRGQLALQGITKSQDILFRKCGLDHPRILYALDSRTQTLLDEHQYEEAIRSANLYSERAELIRGDNSFESCQARRMLGDAYAAQNKPKQAVRVYKEALEIGKHLTTLTDRAIIGVKTQRGLASIAMALREFDQAGESLQVALKLAIEAFGEGDVQVKLVRKDFGVLTSRILETSDRSACVNGS